ncbi:hypothetical protein KSS87_002613 [Heliosperma pusillum]|nr:hypothetical protein KSS87_002613 [Heliosperma pusillum]
MTEESMETELQVPNQLLANMNLDSSDDQLVGLIVENEFLRSQIRGFQLPTQGVDSTEDVKILQKKIELLDSQLDEEKQTRAAAEQALEYLRQSFSEADARAQDLSLQLAQANQKLEQEIKERDDKYSELDSKFTRLHKRAKQRIQDVQKEKDDLEAQFRDANERAERASSEISAVKQELDRARQQASEALKTLDAERQQLRSMNNKLRDNIEELRHSLEPKEHALEALQQSLLEKDQMLDNMQSLLQASEEKKQASIAELTVKHQKRLESLEMQLGEAMSEQNRAAEIISSLKVLVAEKSSKIAELDSALSGESARLKAAIKSVEGELAHEKQEHEKEKEKWEVNSQTLKAKLQTAESQLQLQLSTQIQKLKDQDAELTASREQIRRLEADFSAYKVRAHSLLQKKDAELAAVKDSDQVKALEEALKEAENEISLACSERDKSVHELQCAMTNFEKELSTRDASRKKADQLIRDLEMKLDSQAMRHQSEKEAWELNLRNLEETWREKYERLKSENETSRVPDVTQEMEELKLKYRRLKEEQDSFHDLADRMIEEKDKDISRLLNENKKLQQSLDLKLNGNGDVVNSRALQNEDSSISFLAEDQILMLARQQAQREEELAQSQRHILALQAEIEELERENQLRSQQESMLKEELRNMDRAQKREGLDLTYLKNVLLKLLETGEVEALLPVIAMLLQFSPEEIQKCQQAYTSYADASTNSANDASSSSLFSRFAFG